MKFRKKPVLVEAEQYKPGMEDGFVYDIPMFGMFAKEECINSGFTPDFDKDKIPYIKTLEGNHQISEGDWIITGVKKERYPIKNDIFLLTYEPVEDDNV